jgi:hypothetical protein
MLARMEKVPFAVFPERDLIARDPAEFERLKRERLVRRLPGAGVGDSYSGPSGRLLTVVANPDGSLEAIDDEDPEFGPVPVEPADSSSWQLDLEAVARRVQQANGLSGQPEPLDDRLFFLGEAEHDGLRVAFILGLFPDASSAWPLLAGLPSLLPSGYGRIVVVTPRLDLPPTDRRRLEPLGVLVVPLDRGDLLSLHDAMASGQRDLDEGFDHSDDFRSVRAAGREFSFTPLQAEVVKILYRAHRNRASEVGWPDIRVQLDSEAQRMRDIFKRSDAWGTLIVQGRTKGSYRLNL